MNILVADNLPAKELAPLVDEGHRVDIDPTLDAETLVGVIGDYDVLVVRSTKVPAAVIQAAPRLALIVRSGAGTDTIDVGAASAQGIYVCNVPGRNSLAVAELTMGLLLAVDRHIPSATADLRDDRWEKATYSKADGLFGKTMAIIGLGSIGLAVAERAAAFGIEVTALRRPGRSAEVAQRIKSIGIHCVDTEAELLGGADIVSIHVPKSDATLGMVNSEFLSKMKPNAILLNTARGETMVAADVLRALDGGLRAGLDVFPDEPAGGSATFESKIAAHPNVVGTPHIGASTDQAQLATVAGTVEAIQRYIAGRVENCVNLEHHPRGEEVLTVRHADQVGVLAEVFAVLRAHGVNVQQMSNQVFNGGGAAVASMNLDGSLSPELLSELEAIDAVYGVQTSSRKAS